MKNALRLLLRHLWFWSSAALAAAAPAGPKPLMKDFMGINGHFTFKPELYRKTCGLVRNYHNMNWDVKRPGDAPTFPRCVNKVDWDQLYGSWAKHGFETDVCLMFSSFGEDQPGYQKLWEGQEEWAFRYGRAFAQHFGPGRSKSGITSVEIGNEPGNDFDDGLYRRIFTAMAGGIRKGDPALKIVTCTAHADPSDKYSKNLDETFAAEGIKALYDVINVHTYATKPKREGQSPWARSYPEDPGIEYLKVLDRTIEWRDRHAPGKEVWVTEFGWDACTPAAMARRQGWAQKLDWQGQTELQQAQYLVRSLMLFATRDVRRAYLYFYDDKDEPSVHASSGLTRHFTPKMSYWAVSHFHQQLGDYRFANVIEQSARRCIFEFAHRDGRRRAWVCWLPVEGNEEQQVEITVPFVIARAERMPVASEQGEAIEPASKGGMAGLTLSGSPLYLFSR